MMQYRKVKGKHGQRAVILNVAFEARDGRLPRASLFLNMLIFAQVYAEWAGQFRYDHWVPSRHGWHPSEELRVQSQRHREPKGEIVHCATGEQLTLPPYSNSFSARLKRVKRAAVIGILGAQAPARPPLWLLLWRKC